MPIPRSIRTGLITIILLSLYLVFKRNSRLYRIDKGHASILISLVALCVIAFTYAVLGSRHTDLSFFKPMIYVPVFFFGSYLIYTTFYRDIADKYTIIRDLVKVAVIQSVIVVAMIVIPPLGDAIKVLIQNSDAINSEMFASAGQSFRGNGVSGALFWDFGFQQSLSLILIIWLMKVDSFKKRYFYYFLLIFISVSIISRTGLIGALAAIFLMILLKNRTATRAPMRKFLSIGLVSFLVVSPFINWEAVEDIINFAFEMFINYLDTGEFTSQSTSHLVEDFLFIPPASVVLFGEAQFTNSFSGAFYAGTDSGYIRHFYYWGLLSIVYYSVFIFMAAKSIVRSGNNADKLSLIALWLLLFIVQIKGEIFVLGYQCLSIYFLLYLNFNSNSKYENSIRY